jgi:MFS family permease
MSESGAAIPATATSRDFHGAYYALGVLSLVGLFSQLDRQLTAIIVGPLKLEFHIDDTMFSLLHGYSFALPYAILGLPLGRLIDRYNRRNIIFAGLVSWSMLTIASAFAQSFWQLLILRAGVGIGEAVLAPAAYSLIADLFRPDRRGRAIGIYYLSMSLGAGGSLILGGLLLQTIPPGGLSMGWLAGMSPWRMLFFVSGCPGLFAALLLLFFREPLRRDHGSAESATLRELGQFLWASKATLWRISAISIFVTVVGYGSAAWAPALFERRFGIAPAITALPIGLGTIGGSVIGPIVSGWLSDRWTARGDPSARARAMVLGYAVLLPATMWSIVPSLGIAILLYTLIILSVAIVQCAMPLALQEATPPHMRGQVMAIQLALLGIISIGLGPMIVALVTDHVYQSAQMLRYSLITVSVPVALLGFALSLAAARRSRRIASATGTPMKFA